jgi:formiminoglutamase
VSLIPENWSEVIKQRDKNKIQEVWQSTKPESSKKILSAPCDLGVRLNGGRPGARYAPEAINSVLKKMGRPSHWEDHSLFSSCFKPSSDLLELSQRQSEQTEFLLGNIKNTDSLELIHLGGGHDHILPLMRALTQQKGLCVLNLDAHLDTRLDPFGHSGTPFRQFAEETSKPFHLIQVGIHPYSNPPQNYLPLATGQMDIWPGLEREKLKEWVEAVHLSGPCPGAPILLSLDADGLNASIMEAVSAVNHDGLGLHEVKELIGWYKGLAGNHSAFGIYEYNPVYDNLSQKGARALASLIYEFWKE